jgi:hypothetical protein
VFGGTLSSGMTDGRNKPQQKAVCRKTCDDNEEKSSPSVIYHVTEICFNLRNENLANK